MYEIGQGIVQIKKNTEFFKLNKEDSCIEQTQLEWVKKDVNHNVTRCKKCFDGTSICHEKCNCKGCEQNMKSCSLMSVLGYCNACNCRFEDHERCRFIYEKKHETKQIDIQAFKNKKGMELLEADKVAIFTYIDELTQVIKELE